MIPEHRTSPELSYEKAVFDDLMRSSDESEHREPDTEDDEVTFRQPPQLDDAAIHGPIGALMRVWAPYTEATPAAILIGALATFGAMLGRLSRFILGGDEHAPNLNCLIVGPTGTGRKGTSQGVMRSIMYMVDPGFMDANTAAGLSSGEGIIARLADPPAPEDGTAPPAKDKRLLIEESEFATVARRMDGRGNSLSGVLRQFFDGRPVGTLTKGSRAEGDRGGLRATDHHVAIMAQTTPTELKLYMDRTQSENGFGNRFLYCWSERVRVCSDDRRPADAELRPYTDFLAGVLASDRPPVIDLSRDARTLWKHEMYPALSEGAPGRLGSLTARGPALVRRMAVIYALADGCTVVDPVHLRAARAVWQYSVDSIRYIYGDAVFTDLAVKMLDVITAAESEGVNLTELRHRTASQHIPKAARTRALDELIEAGMVRAEHEQTSGRPRIRVRLTRYALAAGAESLATPRAA